MRAPPLPQPDLFAGRYVLDRVVGQGATANVHLARDTARGIAVAIKILRDELSDSPATGRFLREIRRTAGLHHPHILPVLDSGEYDGRLYVVLPFMEGGTLAQLLKREPHLEFERVLDIARPIADALDYAHKRGLIHRDVKPENILFTENRPCLGDFGIAHALDVSGADSLSSSSKKVVRGTAAYMSPEQAAASPHIDGRSDLYSLACVIYEMITGMQAFIGPTTEMIISQRFISRPRDVRVYRPVTPRAVDDVLAKAFSITPADRYRTASELVAALESALTSSAGPGTSASPLADPPIAERRHVWSGRHARGRITLIGAGLILVVSAAVGLTKMRDRVDPFLGADTTRVAVLPVERDGPDAPPWRDEDLLQLALARYRGITLVDQFQVADAIRRRGPVRSAEDAAAIAAALGAARYVRARVTPLSGGWHVAASLYEGRRGRPLYYASVTLPADVAGARLTYARLADSLLLRGTAADAVPLKPTGSRSLPAIQAFARGQAALDDWDLEVADSAFQAAGTYEPDFARAHLRLAQIRAWQNQPSSAWGTIAERAVALSPQLDDRERRLARALVLLADGAYEEACGEYATLANRNDHDFAAWFGRGQCETMNTVVDPDRRSPSGFRFRMSAQRAMHAYARAFEILPSVHRGYDRGAFERLRVLLMLSRSVVPGYGVDGSLFYGRLGLVNDTLVLVPYPWRVVSRGKPNSVPPGFARALRQRRAEFRRIVSQWSAAFPRSSGTKYAVALSLELLGDPAAIDTVRVARTLATDRTRRVRLGADQATLMLKFGVPDRPELLRGARALGDSLLSRPNATAQEASALVPIAILMGRCHAADSLTRQAAAPPVDAGRIPRRLDIEAQTHLIDVVLGCPIEAPTMTLRALAAAITRERDALPARAGAHLDALLLYRPALFALDSEILARVAQSANTQLIRAALYAARHQRSRAIALLDSSDAAAPAQFTPDIGLAKTRLWLALGDTARATRLLDQLLRADLGEAEPETLAEAGNAAALISALVLRADLAFAAGDTAARRQWASLSADLLASADPVLLPVAQRMRRYATMR